MKKITTFVLGLTAVCALTACGGVKYTETTSDDFNTKQQAAQEKLIELGEETPYYTAAKVTGKVQGKDNGKEKNYEFTVNYEYKVDEEGSGEWTNDAKDEQIETLANQYFSSTAGTYLFTFEMITFTENNIKYYTGDNGGFKIAGNYKGSLDMAGIKAEAECSDMEYIFNEYALLVSAKDKSSSKASMGTLAYESETNVDVKVEYIHK